jgi:PASTA domain
VTQAKTTVLTNTLLLLAASSLVACGSGSSDNSTPLVSVPNVVGDAQAAAQTAITGAGLTAGNITQAASATVASGDVISESPAASTSVAKGSTVALVISSGPSTYTIGGTLIGLGASATVNVVLNDGANVPISANGAFTLPTAVASGGTYSVTVGTPTSAQTCAVQNASGTIASANVTNVSVYCTYNVDAATLKATFTSVGAAFNDVVSGVNYPYDYVSADTFDGVSAISSTYTLNAAGTILPGQTGTETYAVTTANAIPSYSDNSPGLGGVEGTNGDAIVAAEGMISGTQPQIYVAVLPDTNATTDSINGNYTLVDISAQLSTGNMYGYEATITLTNGTVTGTYTENMAGTITTGNPASAQWTVTNGIVTSVGAASGAVSADGDLIVLADTNSGDDPFVNVAVLRGTGVTQATFEGVYNVAQYGGGSVTAISGQATTLFAYGNGTYSLTYTLNNNGTVTTNNTGTGTYTVAADGTLTLTASDGTVYNGAVSADGNALVLAKLTSGRNPAIGVGVRQ